MLGTAWGGNAIKIQEFVGMKWAGIEKLCCMQKGQARDRCTLSQSRQAACEHQKRRQKYALRAVLLEGDAFKGPLSPLFVVAKTLLLRTEQRLSVFFSFLTKGLRVQLD